MTMKPNRSESDNRCALVLDEEITTGQLTLRRLSLDRQLAEVRSQRKSAKEQHHKLVSHYQARSIADRRRLHSIINGSATLTTYFNATKGKYDVNPGDYVVRKHAQLLQLVRSQEILESYIKIAQQQNESIIRDLRQTRQDMRLALQEQHCQRKAIQYQIHEQMVAMVTAKIKAYYKSHQVNNTNEHIAARRTCSERTFAVPTLIQRLVTRKASERCFMMTPIAA